MAGCYAVGIWRWSGEGTGMQLPDTLIKFAESIGSIKCRSWTKTNRDYLSEVYKGVRDLEAAGDRYLAQIEKLISATIELDEFVYKEEFGRPIGYNDMFDKKLPKDLIDLNSKIWFLGEVKKDFERWKALGVIYNHMRTSMRSSANYSYARKGLIELLRKDEEGFRKAFIKELEITRGAVVDQRIRSAKKLYPGIIHVTEGEVDALKASISLKKMGFGVVDTYRSRAIRVDEVVIDDHARAQKKNNRYVLYISGWSLNGAFCDYD